jgi:hypothetical protein
VARQIVHDHDVAGPQIGHENVGDVGFELVAIDRPIEHHRRDHAGHAQPGHQRGGFAVAMRKTHAQALAFGAATMAAGHVGGGPGLVDEHEAFRVQIDLAIEPVVPLLQDVGAVLLDCMSSLFLRVMPRRTKKR